MTLLTLPQSLNKQLAKQAMRVEKALNSGILFKQVEVQDSEGQEAFTVLERSEFNPLSVDKNANFT